MRLAFFIAAMACCTHASFAAERITKNETFLRQAMTYNPATKSRLIEPGVAITAYIKTGYVKRKPEDGADYNDFRRLRKPATLFGHTLLVLQEEYMSKYIGCCVSPGIGAVVEQNGDLAELEAFAKMAHCKIEKSTTANGSFGDVGLKTKPTANYYEISCRERDVSVE